jgi:hypothetical protein
MEISLVGPSLSRWKLNNPKAMSKPPVLVEAVPITLEMGSMVVVAGESMANTGVNSTMLGDAVSTLVGAAMPTMVDDEVVSTMVGAAMPTMAGGVVSTLMSMLMADEVMSMSMAVGDAESTAVADEEPSTLVAADRSAISDEPSTLVLSPLFGWVHSQINNGSLMIL